jgi:hypothetical protein
MELWIFAAVAGLLAVVAFIWFAGRTTRAAEVTVRTDQLYGPLPERDADHAEVTDPASSGQVTPGAVTPAAAGSSEAYYEATGVGSQGPKHLSGPPPAVAAAPAGTGSASSERLGASSRSARAEGLVWAEDAPDASRRNPLPLVALVGGCIGLAIYVAIKRRFRRRSRLERLRMQAEKAATVAGGAASRVAARAPTLPEHVHGRASAGGGAGLLLALLVWALARRSGRYATVEAEPADSADRPGARAAACRARAWISSRLPVGTRGASA